MKVLIKHSRHIVASLSLGIALSVAAIAAPIPTTNLPAAQAKTDAKSSVNTLFAAKNYNTGRSGR